MHVTHITLGQVGLQADSSEELHAAIAAVQAAGYTVTDIEDDPDEPWHVATILTRQNATEIKNISALVR